MTAWLMSFGPQNPAGNQSDDAAVACSNGSTADEQCTSADAKPGSEGAHEQLDQADAKGIPPGWDPGDLDVDYHEPLHDVSTEVPEADWMGSRESASTAGPTTRQEDTELGIFREDDV